MTAHALETFPFQQFLKEFPQGVFANYMGQSPLSSFQQRLQQPQFGSFSNQYQGYLANLTNQGQLPTTSFQDYLGSLDPYREFYSRFASPQSRGTLTRNPFTTFNYNQQR